MSQRQLVWRALADAGVLESDDPKVREFVQLLRDRDLCWPDLVSEFRSKYYDVFEKFIPALEQSDDPFIRNALIRYADPDRPKERQLLKTLATTTNFERDQVAATQLSELGVKEIDTVLKKRLPGGVEGLLAERGGEGAPPAGGAEAAGGAGAAEGAASGGGNAGGDEPSRPSRKGRL